MKDEIFEHMNRKGKVKYWFS